METILTTWQSFNLGGAVIVSILSAFAVMITAPKELRAHALAKLALLMALIGLGVQLYPPDIMKQSALPIEAETEAVEFTPPDMADITPETPAEFTPPESPIAVEFTQPDVTFSPVGGPNVTPIVGFSIIFLGTVIIAVLAYVLGRFIG